jgi:glycosyltransferase involved in cell wall biosynthesis
MASQSQPHPRTYLAALGDTNDPLTWSGIPFYFLTAGRAAGLIDEGLKLLVNNKPWRARRTVWNLVQVAMRRRHGGYQYQTGALERLYAPFRDRLQGSVVINCFQIYPPSIVRDQRVEKWFYIDMTMRQLFDDYGAPLDPRTAAKVLAQERTGYEAATGIITHSRWAAQSVVGDYGIPADRVHTVVPGANLDSAAYAQWEQGRTGPDDNVDDPTMKLVYVGSVNQRKGVDRLLGAFRLLRQQGVPATLRIIGADSESMASLYRDVEGVEWLGFMDKRRDAARFLAAVAECHIGCLLSRAEAGGMVLREFHALGLAVLGPAVGGAPEHMIPGSSIAVPPAASDKEIADILLMLWQDRPRLRQMRRQAWNSRRNALWESTVARFRDFWPHTLS